MISERDMIQTLATKDKVWIKNKDISNYIGKVYQMQGQEPFKIRSALYKENTYYLVDLKNVKRKLAHYELRKRTVSFVMRINSLQPCHQFLQIHNLEDNRK